MKQTRGKGGRSRQRRRRRRRLFIFCLKEEEAKGFKEVKEAKGSDLDLSLICSLLSFDLGSA